MEHSFPKLPGRGQAFWEWIERFATLITLAGFAYTAWKWARRSLRLPSAVKNRFSVALGGYLALVSMLFLPTSTLGSPSLWLETHSTETFLARASTAEASHQPLELSLRMAIIFPLLVIGAIVLKDVAFWILQRAKRPK